MSFESIASYPPLSEFVLPWRAAAVRSNRNAGCVLSPLFPSTSGDPSRVPPRSISNPFGLVLSFVPFRFWSSLSLVCSHLNYSVQLGISFRNVAFQEEEGELDEIPDGPPPESAGRPGLSSLISKKLLSVFVSRMPDPVEVTDEFLQHCLDPKTGCGENLLLKILLARTMSMYTASKDGSGVSTGIGNGLVNLTLRFEYPWFSYYLMAKTIELTVLRYACLRAFRSVVAYLLVSGKFTSRDVGLDEKIWAFAVEGGSVEILKILLTHPDVDPSASHNYAVICAAERGNLELVQILAKDSRVKASDAQNQALRHACKNGHMGIVRFLLTLPGVVPNCENQDPLILASQGGHVEIVRFLLADERVDPGARNCKALIEASREGREEVVKLLLQDARVDAGAQESEALFRAVTQGHAEIVKNLLANERTDPLAGRSRALNSSLRGGRSEVIQPLLLDDRVPLDQVIEQIVQFFLRSKNEEAFIRIERFFDDPAIKFRRKREVFDKFPELANFVGLKAKKCSVM